jgi:hypothetical protein
VFIEAAELASANNDFEAYYNARLALDVMDGRVKLPQRETPKAIELASELITKQATVAQMSDAFDHVLTSDQADMVFAILKNQKNVAKAALDAKPAHVRRALAAHISEVEVFEQDETAKVLAMSVDLDTRRLVAEHYQGFDEKVWTMLASDGDTSVRIRAARSSEAMSVMSVRKRLLGDPVTGVVKRAEDTLNGID